MFRKVNVPSSVLQKRRDKLSESSSSTSESHSALSQNNSEAFQENLSSKDDLSFATSSSASSHSSSSSSSKSSVSSSSYIRHSHKSNASNDAKSERTSKEKKLYEEVLQTKETKIILDKSAEADENKQKNAVEEEEDEEVLNRVKDFKLLQKTRKRNKGLNAQKLFSMEEKVEEEEEEDETAGYGLLDRQFTSKGDPTTIEVDTHLEEFLKAHLEKNAEKEEEKTPKIDDKTAELYKIPEHLQVKDTISEHADRMNWVTGLMEVPLPLEVKLKNIEATEKAKRALLKLGKKDHNYTEDPDYIVHKAFGSRFQNYDRFPKSKLSTDKATLDRFRKRFRR